MTEQSDATRVPQNATSDEHKAQRNKKLLARQVARYLIQNPDFFSEHMELLENIQLPRENGKTVSLMTHQTNLLRERNIEMRQRLDQLLQHARENDQLFRHTRRLILALLEADNVGEATQALYDSFAGDFGVEFTRLILFSPLPQGRHILGEARTSSRVAAEAAIGSILRNSRTICGVLRPAEREYLFDKDGDKVASAAVVPLANQLGVLTVGSSDPQHYRSSLGTLFLSYIGEVLERLVPRLLAP